MDRCPPSGGGVHRAGQSDRLSAVLLENPEACATRCLRVWSLPLCRILLRDTSLGSSSKEGRGASRFTGAARREATVEGAGGTNAPPAGPSGVCAASAARPGTSRDSVQAVVLPGRHRRPVTSPMSQLGGPVECPSLPPWCTYNDEPSCLIAAPSRNPSLLPVKAPAGLLAGRAALIAGESNQIMGRVAGQGDREYSRHRVRPRPAQDADVCDSIGRRPISSAD
jgi:hypothetical protein